MISKINRYIPRNFKFSHHEIPQHHQFIPSLVFLSALLIFICSLDTLLNNGGFLNRLPLSTSFFFLWIIFLLKQSEIERKEVRRLGAQEREKGGSLYSQFILHLFLALDFTRFMQRGQICEEVKRIDFFNNFRSILLKFR